MVRCMTSATALLCASSVLASSELAERGSTKSKVNCIACNPSGWKNKNGPAIGANMTSLYVNLVQSVKTIRFRRDTTLVEDFFTQFKRASAPICCTDGTQCVLLSKYQIPFCYDKYTTNFLFPDGSKGNIANGTYFTNANPRDTINLISGNVTSSNTSYNGTNIYSGDASSDKPNTSTLPIPPVYTAAGDGTIITDLGSGILTVTGPTTIPATTRQATTIPATTGTDGKVTPARTISATTIPAITVAAVSSRAAAAHLRAGRGGGGGSNSFIAGLAEQGDGLTLERVVMLYMGMMGVFGGMVMMA